MFSFKKGVALLAAVSMVFSLSSVDFSKAAKSKPVLSNKKVTLKVSQTKKIKVKKLSKKAKVTWKTSKKSVVFITKQKKNGAAYATIKAKKAGNAVITAKCVDKKSKTTLKCKVTVTGKAKKNTANSVSKTTPKPEDNKNAQTTPLPTQTPIPTANPAKWVTTWGTAEEKAGTMSDDPKNESMPKMALEGTTIREAIKITTSGKKLRFRLSNQYGDVPVVIGSMHIAKQIEPTKSDIDLSTDTVVTQNGSEKITIPVGEVILTDPVDFNAVALDTIAISMYIESAPTLKITAHRGARSTTYQVAGNSVSSATIPKQKKTLAWYFLADCSVWMEQGGRSIVCFGDSITDGYGTDKPNLGGGMDKKGQGGPDQYTRWEDFLAKRLQANEGTKDVAVINEGIGSNGMLGSYPTDSGKDRFQRDLLQHDAVEYCIILFGVNDLNQLKDTTMYDKLLPEYQKMVKLCHDNNIKVYGAPILPFGAHSYYSENSEKVRNMINDWMRSTDSQMDGIIDFESVLADPANPTCLLKEYTSDGLHPHYGYDVMGAAVDLSLFEKK